MLEDDFTYVIRKAFRGLNMAPAIAAKKADLSENDVLSFSRGHFSKETALRLAPVLGLNATALGAHPGYLPRPLALESIQRLDLPFDGERVNAWSISQANVTLLFDTGYDGTSCEKALADISNNTVDCVFITHGHADHVGGLKGFLDAGMPAMGPQIAGAREMKPGDSMKFGELTVRAIELSGHCTPALGYHIDGLEVPVLVTGDALFAGSIGGCQSRETYLKALHSLKRALAGLADETILLPGHGPATTVGEERVSNPFL